MFVRILLLSLASFCPSAVFGGDDFFAQIEEIYLAVFEDIVRHHVPDRMVATIQLHDNNTIEPGLPAGLWKRLKQRLVTEQDGNTNWLVPAGEVAWNKENMKFIHTPSGKGCVGLFDFGDPMARE